MSTIERAIDKLGQAGQGLSADLDGEAKEGLAVGRGGAVRDLPQKGIDGTRQENLHGSEGSQPRIDLNFETLRRSGMVTPDSDRSQIAEEFRHIKRPLLLNAFGEGAIKGGNSNLIMVTSARPGEGKTFTTINLALSIALERDLTVLLVDADVAKPSVARVLNFPGTAGLVDYLADQDRSLSDLILQTSLPKLRILPSGRRHAHSTELLASDSMSKLVKELAHRYPDRVVLFDSPPLLATSEAAVLAGLMGQVVMVVEAGKTKREELNEALERLNPNQYTALVLNKSGKPFGADYYYGGYQAYGE